MDHPRSRGVYLRPRGRLTWTPGSSPLARGLRNATSCYTLCARIIPARAGFTCTAGRITASGRDHPRSRGVYPGRATGAARGPGSSPLARGLRRPGAARRRLPRIIPARAGFTPDREPFPPCAPDHPRSRGVYASRPLWTPTGIGSSPLARGLQGSRGDALAPHRIIPARAGFTHSARPARAHAQDHPRSRGVYSARMETPRSSIGSSPLARGLHALFGGVGEQGGIIPARAGFTFGGRHRRASTKDHPRSRGVYRRGRLQGHHLSGSSPLARGLLLLQNDPGLPAGIIPARAGFTLARLSRRSREADHPRSRGVYRAESSLSSASSGSSPLARGLRSIGWRTTRADGIIPARAGFTPSPMVTAAGPVGSSPLARGLHPRRRPTGRAMWIIPARAGFTLDGLGQPPGRRDHPRSRGVYCRGADSNRPAGGSSPLARGLPKPPSMEPRTARIIPARAGFTGDSQPRRPRLRDHPRSRGVYGVEPPLRPSRLGSSPLARGLRRHAPGPDSGVGIIPARAGFTCGGGGRGRGGRDHPRSRGVYSQWAVHPALGVGSSPLARGLPPSKAYPAPIIRIIPARAGFTAPPDPYSCVSRDHPRSRGVYGVEREEYEAGAGSSPLARGLRRTHLGPSSCRRIIPARAGFTSPPPATPSPCPDHPRSRGVYGRYARPDRDRWGSSPLARGLPRGWPPRGRP